METRRLITLLMLMFFTAGLIGCDKLAEKKAKEDFRKGTFHPSPGKSYRIGS